MSETNDITELRTHLFGTLRALRDKTDPMEVGRAKAVCEVAETIINTAKVEIAFINATGGQGTGFLPLAPAAPPQAGKDLPRPPLRTITHRMKG